MNHPSGTETSPPARGWFFRFRRLAIGTAIDLSYGFFAPGATAVMVTIISSVIAGFLLKGAGFAIGKICGLVLGLPLGFIALFEVSDVQESLKKRYGSDVRLMHGILMVTARLAGGVVFFIALVLILANWNRT